MKCKYLFFGFYENILIWNCVIRNRVIIFLHTEEFINVNGNSEYMYNEMFFFYTFQWIIKISR